MNDVKVNLEGLLLSYYIKYDRLFTLCNASLADINTNTVNIYIDLYDMLKPIYTRDVYADKKYLIVSSIINLAAHMRGYFWTRHRLYTNIFLVYGESITMQHKQFYPAFGDEKFKQTMNFYSNDAFIHSQLQLTQILAAYIPGVYYIPKASDFSMFVYDNILQNHGVPSIIITKSKYAYQIPALLDNAIIFRPKKKAGEDLSFAITNKNVFRAMFDKVSSASTIEKLREINPMLLSMMLTLTGLPSSNLNTLINITTATSMLHKAVNGRIINSYNSDPDYAYMMLDGISKYIDPVAFKSRFNAVDLITQHRIYLTTAEASDITWLMDLDDPDTFRSINNRYFIDNPLDLNSL